MENKPQHPKSLKITFVVLLFIIGGHLGLIAIMWDWLKKSEFKQNSTLPIKSTVSGLIQFLGIILALNILSPFFIEASNYLSLDTFEAYIPFIAQALIVIIATHKLLHERNVFFTNLAFWEQFKATDWTEASKDLALKDFMNPHSPSAPKQPSASPAPESTQQAQTATPILVDQSDDQKRILLIVLALLFLLMFLAYYYFFDIQRIASERAEQVLSETLKAEGEY